MAPVEQAVVAVLADYFQLPTRYRALLRPLTTAVPCSICKKMDLEGVNSLLSFALQNKQVIDLIISQQLH